MDGYILVAVALPMLMSTKLGIITHALPASHPILARAVLQLKRMVNLPLEVRHWQLPIQSA
jgi:hypothetical protein